MITDWLLKLAGVCPHDHRYREYRGDVLSLVCESCGHAVPAITRPDTWVRSEVVPSKAVKVPKAGKVTQMRRAR